MVVFLGPLILKTLLPTPSSLHPIFIAPEQKFDFIEHLSSIVLLLKLSNTTAVYKVLVDTHSRDCQLQIVLIRILIYIINNDYFITTGLSMLALRELQATILSNPCVNHAMHHVALRRDLHFSLEPLDSLLMVAVPWYQARVLLQFHSICIPPESSPFM